MQRTRGLIAAALIIALGVAAAGVSGEMREPWGKWVRLCMDIAVIIIIALAAEGAC